LLANDRLAIAGIKYCFSQTLKWKIRGLVMGEITKEEMRDRLGNIDQIRDIIFGAQLREYANRFDKIESDLSLLQQEMRDRVDQVKNVLATELRSSIDSLDNKIKTLNVNVQDENAELRQNIGRVNKKFSTNIEALNETVDQQTNSIRQELSQTREKLHEDVRTLRANIFEDLDRRFSMLRDVKVSRDDMAEILFEVGMRIKGIEFVPELKEAAETDGYTDVPIPE
jgi:DNA anti-recombination protein RmuC